MKKLLTASVAASALLTGCAMPSMQPPTSTEQDYSKSYNAEFTSVWDTAVDWFADNNIPIKNIEKDSGIISSEYSLGASATQIDCGTLDPGDLFAMKGQSATANLNVLIRERSGLVSVKPNVFGSGAFTVHDIMNNREVTMPIDYCVSSGELERSLHTYLNSNI